MKRLYDDFSDMRKGRMRFGSRGIAGLLERVILLCSLTTVLYINFDNRSKVWQEYEQAREILSTNGQQLRPPK